MAQIIEIAVTYSAKQVINKLFGALARKKWSAQGGGLHFRVTLDSVDVERDLLSFLQEKKAEECVEVKLLRGNNDSGYEDLLLKKVSDLGLSPRVKKAMASMPDLTVGELISKPWRYSKAKFKGLGRRALTDIQDQLAELDIQGWD